MWIAYFEDGSSLKENIPNSNISRSFSHVLYRIHEVTRLSYVLTVEGELLAFEVNLKTGIFRTQDKNLQRESFHDFLALSPSEFDSLTNVRPIYFIRETATLGTPGRGVGIMDYVALGLQGNRPTGENIAAWMEIYPNGNYNVVTS